MSAPWRCRLLGHDFPAHDLGIGSAVGLEDFAPTGYATMGWDCRAHREFGGYRKCKRDGCTERKHYAGYYVPGDNPGAYRDGWPYTDDGQRMPVAA